MKKLFVVFVFAFYCIIPVFAQSDILIEIDDKKINADEFLHIYQKNNNSENSMTYEAMMEYMDLFINFKLKVFEAERLGLDTTKAFKQELDGYRQQLAQPYFVDKSVEEEIFKEAYERMKHDIKVSHILVKVDPAAAPADTLAAYKKIYNIYDKLKKGADFTKTAEQYSEDESVKSNKGNLGWRTAFGLVYEFETVMYNTEVGKFSEPFRTRFGYHILKVENKRPAKGKYKVAHIMFITPHGIAESTLKLVEERVYEVMDKINKGEDFSELAKAYSEDRQTAANGGNLGWIEVGGKMIQEFEELVFSLENVGEVSKPIRTSYGWHIIKLLEKQEIKPYEEAKTEIKNKVSNSAQASKSKTIVIERLKKEYNYKFNQKALNAFYTLVTDSIFEGTWDASDALMLSGVLFEFGDKVISQADFAKYLDRFNRKQTMQDIKTFVDNSFNSFVNRTITEYEQSRLELKYPAFKYLIQEYHDGILLFDLTDQLVWTKAVNDTVGLNDFYNKNKDNYMWDTRYEIKQYKCNNEKNYKALKKMLAKNVSDDIIIAKLNKKDSLAVQIIMNQKVLKMQDPLADELIAKSKVGDVAHNKSVFDLSENIVASVEVIPPMNKSLNEARGIVTADYQNYLEKEWVKILRSKYNIIVHEDVLRNIATKK